MSVQYNAASYLHKFANFANVHKNDGDAIAKFDEANNPMSRKISVNTGDHLRGFFNWKFHGEENAAGNNMIRQEFILNVLKCLGWEPAQHGIAEGHVLTQAEIKEAVNTLLAGPENKARRTALLDALKVKDYGCGKPLTARRISATLEQVKTIVESREKRDDFWVVDKAGSGTEERLADPDSINARILRRLEPDMEVLATPGNDDLLPGGNAPVVLPGGNAPVERQESYESNQSEDHSEDLDPQDSFESNQSENLSEDLERQESFASNQSEKFSEKLSFQGDGDIIGGAGIDEDDKDDIKELFEGNVSKEKQEIPAQTNISVQKNVSNEKGPNRDNLIMTMMEKRVRNLNNDDYVLNRRICSNVVNFFADLCCTEYEEMQSRHGISQKQLMDICMALQDRMNVLSADVSKGNLNAVVDRLKATRELNVEDTVLRRVLLDVFKAYNEQQQDENLRVAIS